MELNNYRKVISSFLCNAGNVDVNVTSMIESMCCTTTGYAKPNSIISKPNISGETRAQFRDRAHIVERRDGAPRGG
jgi:hypothetical protein